ILFVIFSGIDCRPAACYRLYLLVIDPFSCIFITAYAHLQQLSDQLLGHSLRSSSSSKAIATSSRRSP
ncbi:hypothetical protein NOF04DRAFT_1395340, partial [Fusarium oxysporum II5]